MLGWVDDYIMNYTVTLATKLVKELKCKLGVNLYL